MNKRQQVLILSILSKLAMIGTFLLGFWIFILQMALCVYWWNKPIWFALMSSAMSVVVCVLCFISWVVLDMWSKDPSTIPSFKIERRGREKEPEGDDKKRKEEETLPLF